MATEIICPNSWRSGPISIFLAGTIDNGKSEDWQSVVVDRLKHFNVQLLNPRRTQWDSSLEQTINNPAFVEQVTWELDSLQRCDIIIMNLVGNSKSPISLLELGLFASSGKLMVTCGLDFYRRGNVEIVCDRYDIPLYSDLNELIKDLLYKVQIKKMSEE